MGAWLCLTVALSAVQGLDDWQNSTIGLPQAALADPTPVPPPFTPVERTAGADGLTLAVVGRTIELTGRGLPTQIRAAGENLLREPVTLRALAGGQPLDWRWEPPRLGDRGASYATWTAAGTAADWRLSIAGRLEYDGLMILDLELAPPGAAATLDSLSFEIPLLAERALLHTWWPGQWGSAQNSGALPDDGLAVGFKPLLWVGDNARGLSLCAESDEGWRPADPERVLTVGPADDRTVVAHLVDQPVELTGPWRTQLLLHPTPIKPMPADPHHLRINHGGNYGIEDMEYYAGYGRVRYEAEGLVNPSEGTLEAWVSPGFDPNVALTDANRPGRGRYNRNLFKILLADGTEAGYYWNIDDRGMRYYVRRNGKVPVVIGAPMPWQPGEVHQIALTWGDELRLYHDGQLVNSTPWSGLFRADVDLGGAVFEVGGDTATFGIHALRLERTARTEFTPDQPPQRTEATTLLEVGDALASGGELTGGIRAPGKFGSGLYFYDPTRPLMSLLDGLQAAGVRTLMFHEHWTDIQDYGVTPYADQLRKLTEACHQRGMKLCVYFGYEMSNIAPEWDEWHERCLVAPRRGGYKREPEQTAYIVCFNSIWQNFTLESIAHAVDEYGVDGVYLDGTIEPWGCANELHGCGYVGADGERHPTYPILAVRQLMRRMHTLLAERRAEPVVDAHQSLCMMTPTLSWCTGYWDGEQLTAGYTEGKAPLDYLPLATFRAEFMGWQYGVPAQFLNYSGRPFTPAEAMAFSLLHDVLPRGSGMNEVQERVTPIWRAMDAFGRTHAEFVGYWRSGDQVTASPGEVKVSLWRRDGAVLVAIANLGNEAAAATVELSEGALPGPLAGRDALTGEPVAIDGRALRLDLPSLAYRLLEIRTGK